MAAARKPEGNTLASQLAENIKHRFPAREQNTTLAASTFLDVRFKHVVFADNGNVEKIRSKLINDMQKLHREQVVAPPVVTTSEPAVATATPGLWQEFDIRVRASQGNRTVGTDSNVQMRRYLEEKVIFRNEDPLVWWQQNEGSLPLLSQLAKKYLGTVASSVPSERLFSKAGDLISPKRNRLKPKNVNMLLFLNANLPHTK